MELLKLLFVTMIIFGIIWLVLEKKRGIWKGISEKVENLSNRRVCLGLFLFILLSEGWLVFLRKLPFVADEVYTLSGSAFFAGYNWSSYMHLHKFYNFGYTMLLMPLYKIFSDPIYIYRAMLFANVVVHALAVVIVYYIANRKLKCSKLSSIAIAFVSTCNSIILFFKGFVYNEMPLAFVVWLIILLLLELVESVGKKRVILSAILGFVTAYAYIIHSRCLVVFGTLAVLVLLYLIIYKKWVVQPVAFISIFSVCIYSGKMLVEYVKENLYLTGNDVLIGNSVEEVATGTWQYAALTSVEGIGKLICQFFSLAGGMSIETGGLLTIVSAASLYYLFKNFKQYRTGKISPSIFVLITYSFVSFWGMVVCIALAGASNGKARFLIYSRYLMPFLGTFLLLGLWILKKQKKQNGKWIGIWSGVLNLIVGAVFVFYSYPRLLGTSMKHNASLYFFIPFSRYTSSTKFAKNVFGIALLLLVAFTAIQLFLYYRKQFVAFCVVAMIFSVSLFWQIERLQCEPAAERRYQACNATYSMIKKDKLLDSKNIYCLGTEVYRKAVLVSAYDKNIGYDAKEIQINKDAVLLSNRVKDLEKYNATYIYQLDKNEWVGFWDDKITDDFEKIYTPYSVQ